MDMILPDGEYFDDDLGELLYISFFIVFEIFDIFEFLMYNMLHLIQM